MEELLTTKELSELLRLNEKKIYQLIREEGIPHVKIAGKWLFPKAHVLGWLDERVERERDIFIVGSDDQLLGRLLSAYSQENLTKSLAFYSPVGSLNGIRCLTRKKGQACCIHLFDPESGQYNLPYLARYGSPEEYRVITLWHRSQGLLVKKGNPLGLRNLEDVVRRQARFVQRNPGSGTRILVEYLLTKAGLDGKQMLTLPQEAGSHLEVGLKVLSGEADAGLGIEIFAHFLSLDFIPIQQERFDLVVPKNVWATKIMNEFVDFLDPVQTHRLSQNFQGYSFRDTGKILW